MQFFITEAGAISVIKDDAKNGAKFSLYNERLVDQFFRANIMIVGLY